MARHVPVGGDMGIKGVNARRAGAAGLVASLLVVGTAMPSGTAQAGDQSRGGTSAPAAGGEQWYGYVSTRGQNTHKLSDHGTYTSHDSFTLKAPEDATEATMNITVDVVVTHPDPDPDNDGCYTKRQTWEGSGVVPASFSVQSNVGGANYIILVDALQPIQVNTETKYGGVLGGAPCSDGNTDGTMDYAPWIQIHSGKNAEVNFRQGSNTIRARPDGLGGGCAVVSECTDYPALGSSLPRMTSNWSISARDCTGYSTAHRLGRQDTLFVFTPRQTRCLSARVNFLQEVSGTPKVCDYAFVKRLAQACRGYKAVTRVQWSQVDWFMAAAVRTDACGLWVVDRAGWRSPKVKPAHGPKGEIAWISRGDSAKVKTASGTITVRCP